MKCPQCGLFNPDEAQRCDCGYDFTTTRGHAEPPTYFVPALLTLLLSLPFGVLALVFSSQVHQRFIAGDLAGAQRASQLAGAMCAAGLAISAVLALIFYLS